MTKQIIKDPNVFKCPDCGRTCEIGLPCSCGSGINFNVLEERRGRGLICVGYSDKKGNIFRVR